MNNEKIKHWINIVSEAYEGSTNINQTIDKGLRFYNREQENFNLPKDYPEIKTIADLLQSLDHFLKQFLSRIEDPAAEVILSKIKNVMHPEKMVIDLDKLAKLKNPEE